MNLNNELINGFRLIESTKVEEINSTANIFYHEKSGARLLFLENDDDNKVFSISFRTPPKDSTGVAHILEHSVLCGSKKFPVKEPFVELAKGSLNTFLNAMTFGDKTMYPVASTNDKDFTNLMNVYLDAVLHPNIYQDKLILMQEGWHYDIENAKDDITYKGVVYNEMKGAFSSPESILFRKISETLFPNTTYGVESGGDPEFIPDLTNEEFLAFHKKYYHPSNSYIFLYGNLNIEEKLKFINENYLKEYNKEEITSKIELQKPFSEIIEATHEYSLSKNEDEKNKCFLSLNFAVDTALNKETYFAFDILEYVLLEAPGAPLKKALIEKGIGKDVFGMYDSGSLQPVFSIVVKGSEESRKEEFKKIVFETLENIVEKGIDKKSIEGAINKREFELRENDFNRYPKGIVFSIKVMDSWLYDGHPLLHLQYEDVLQKVKAGNKVDYFEALLKKYVIDNKHGSLLVVKPKKGLEEIKANELKEKLKKFKETLTEEELNNLVADSAKLKERQTKKDSPEALRTIPTLTLGDLDRNPQKLELTEKKYKDIQIIHSDIFTNKINYVNLIFNTNHIEEELVPYLPLLARTIGRFNTKNYLYEDISKEININTGGVEFGASSFFCHNSKEELYPYFNVKGKAISEKTDDLFRIMEELCFETKFEDTQRLREVLDELKSRMEMYLNEKGHAVSSMRALSYTTDSNKYTELVSGVSFYNFIVDLEKNFDSKKDEILNNLSRLKEKIFNKDNLIISITCSEEEYPSFENNFKNFYKSLFDNKLTKVQYKYENLNTKNEGFKTSGKVQFVSKAANLTKLGFEYNGNMQVLKSILSLDYLWNRVRVMGGAYGGFASFQRSGNMFFTSYRDPNLKATLNIYDDAYNYLKDFKADEETMTKYIIGTISDLDSPLSPSMQGERAFASFIKNVTYADLKKEREEILCATEADIRKLSEMVKKAMEVNNICVVGNEDNITNNEELFETVKQLIN